VGANGHGSEKAENGGHANHIGDGQDEQLRKSGYGRVVMEEWLDDVLEVKAAQAHLYRLLSSVLQSVLLPYIVSSPPILPGSGSTRVVYLLRRFW
jgi:hypothetical protein